MKYGARNAVKGKVLDIKNGNLMTRVKVEIPKESILSSVMTIESMEEMDLKEGDAVRVVVKAVNVLLVKE